MKFIPIEVTNQEYDRWLQLDTEERATPIMQFIRALNDRWNLSQAVKSGEMTEKEKNTEWCRLFDNTPGFELPKRLR